MEEYKGFWRLLAYSSGMGGWSVLMNTIWVMLVFFYLPPESSGMPVLVPQVLLLGVLTVLSLVLASGRLLDAVTDPLIAWLSDRNKWRWGRRIPFMAIAVIPSLVFSMLLFTPLHNFESKSNFTWLVLMQIGFYVSITMYIVPFNALMPELAKSKDSKLIFSTFLSVMFIVGIVIASQIPWLAGFLKSHYQALSYQGSYFYAIAIVNAIAFILMIIPVLTIEEKKYCNAVPVASSPLRSLKTTLKNRKFTTFLVADASFFLTLALISTGIIYYVKVLAGLSDAYASRIMGLMILLSLLFYPLVIWFVRRTGVKKIIILSFFMFSLIMFYSAFLGMLPFSPVMQMYIICFAGAFPFAVLGILPYTIIAEVADSDGKSTGEQKEGMYFAVRTFFGKVGQTMGVVIFTVFTIYGKDIGDDLGIRLSAIAGGVVTLFAGIWFTRFRQ